MSTRRPSSLEIVRDLDPKSRAILFELWRAPLSSRTEISERTKIDPSSVSRTMAHMIACGLVVEVEEGMVGPQGGRKPVKLKISPEFGLVAGVEIGSETCDFNFIDLEGNTRHQETIAFPSKENNFTIVANYLVRHALAVAKRLETELLGIGFGIPGLINEKEGVILNSQPLQITKPLEISKSLSLTFNIPVVIDNDVRCCCHAEISLNRRGDQDDFLFILGEFRDNIVRNASFHGIALGMGLVINGRVHSGQNNTSGEFRSSFYEEPQSNNQFSIPDGELANLEHSKEVQYLFAAELGKNVAVLVNVINLPKVIVGGSLVHFGPDFLERLLHQIKMNWQYHEQGPVEILFSPFGDHSVSYGAASNLLMKIFKTEQKTATLN